MSEEAPAASVSEAVSAEPSTPATPASEAAPATTPEQSAQTVATTPAEGANNYFTNEQLAEMQKMFENNGGYEKAWGKMKDAISRPQSVTQPETVQPVAQQVTQPTPSQAQQATQNSSQSAPEGSFSITEMMVDNQFKNYANEPQYASIADDIRSKKVLEGLRDFNIDVMKNGFFNDRGVRKYLDLYAATKPATQTSTVPENTARIDYYNVPDEKAMTYEQATQIEMQNVRLRAAGQPEHPLTEKAKEVVKAHFAPKTK